MRVCTFSAQGLRDLFLSSRENGHIYNITHKAQSFAVIHSGAKLAPFVGLPILSTKSVDNLVGKYVRSLKTRAVGAN